MRRASFEDMDCSIAQCLEVVGEWWTPLIVRDLFLGITRFEQLQKRLGIARNVLTDRLNHLTEHGVVERVPYSHSPLRHEYQLTEKGRDLWLVITAMRQWGDSWAAPDGPPVIATHRSCQHETTVTAVCSECGEPLGPGELKMHNARPGGHVVPSKQDPAN